MSDEYLRYLRRREQEQKKQIVNPVDEDIKKLEKEQKEKQARRKVAQAIVVQGLLWWSVVASIIVSSQLPKGILPNVIGLFFGFGAAVTSVGLFIWWWFIWWFMGDVE